MRLPDERPPVYRTCLADPPWSREQGGGKIKRGAQAHYPLLKNHDIVDSMRAAPQWEHLGDSAHMYCWTTNSALEDGLFVLKALGFRYVTTITWVKMTCQAITYTWIPQNPGLGRYFRGCTEQLLFGVRGKAMVPKPIDRGTTRLLAPRRQHSRKPDEQYELIEKVSPGAYLEMFARGNDRPGWTPWGLEAGRKWNDRKVDA